MQDHDFIMNSCICCLDKIHTQKALIQSFSHTKTAVHTHTHI